MGGRVGGWVATDWLGDWLMDGWVGGWMAIR